MRRLLVVTFIIPALLLAACGAPAADPPPDGACSDPNALVAIPDRGLKEKVAETLELGAEPISCGDMLKLENLTALGSGISNLEGLQHATNLAMLDVTWNQISDLAPLSGLEKLNSVLAGDNKLSDVTPLLGLPDLRYLSLWKNQIGSMDDIYKLTKLQSVIVDYNPLPYSQLGCLGELPDLEGIGVGGFGESGALDLVLNHPNAPSINHVSIGGNQITSIDGLARLPKLRNLEAQDNSISDISVLHDKDLRFVNLDDNLISDLQPLVENHSFGQEAGTLLFVRRNCLDFSAGSGATGQITALEAQGVRVFYEEQRSDCD